MECRTHAAPGKGSEVHNEEAFGPVTGDTIVIAIQGLNPMSHVAPGY